MKFVKILFAFLLLSIPLSMEAQHSENYTVVVSLDGCRWDYPQWYDTPFFDNMADEGVESGLIPSFPSKTFPNHYTLATGLYPDHHGIVANTFFDAETGARFSLSNPQTKYDPKYYGGEPIWLTAQRQGLRAAVFYWPGSDVKVKGRSPWRYYSYDELPRLTYDERIEGIINMLMLPAEERPRLIMAYFEQPDHNGHRYGPQSKHTRTAVEQMDRLMQVLYSRIRHTPIGNHVNFIVLSDHGMTTLSEQRLIDLKGLLPQHWVKAIEGNVPTNLYVNEGYVDSVYYSLATVDHIKYWRKQDIPAYLHYGSNERVGDIVVTPDIGWVIGSFEEYGSHGFDPEYNDMHALFRAVGPAFRHVALPHFPNVSVYPLLCHLLGITPAECDGHLEDVTPMLNEHSKK